MEPDSLIHTVEAHARARAAGETAVFASYMTPRAILQLRDERLPDRAPCDVASVADDGASGESVVRFRGGVELRERWQRIDGLWRAVSAEVHAARRRMPRISLRRASADDRA